MASIFKKLTFITLLLFFVGGTALAQNPRRTKATIKTSAECKFCKQSIEKSLGAMNGVRKVTCDYQKHEVYVMFNSKKTSLNDIKKALNDLGYDADDQPASNVKANSIKQNK